MAKLLDIPAQPQTLCFAGDPLIYEAQTYYSLKEDESFLRILCKATFTLKDVVPYYKGSSSFVVELSQLVENNGRASFNLSDAAQTLIQKVMAQVDMNGDYPLSSIGLTADVECVDVWIRDNHEVYGRTEWAKADRVYIIPGALTDYERIIGDASRLGLFPASRSMTRKPDGGILYRGEEPVIPWVIKEDDPTSSWNNEGVISVDGVEVSRVKDAGYVCSLNHLAFPAVDSGRDGSFELESTWTKRWSGYYRANAQGVHFLRFINGFGAVENISVRAKDKLSYEVSGETYSLVQEASVRPIDRRYATKSQPVGVYELSSGYVPQKWAEWYVQELLTSPRVWIQLGGKWIPALIEAEDDCVIYDRTKPEMPHVDFTLRLAIDGVIGVIW